jgi:hypothetical protein
MKNLLNFLISSFSVLTKTRCSAVSASSARARGFVFAEPEGSAAPARFVFAPEGSAADSGMLFRHFFRVL